MPSGKLRFIKQNMLKKAIPILLMVSLLSGCTGGFSQQLRGNVSSLSNPDTMLFNAASGQVATKDTAILYFRYLDTNMLVSETRSVDVAVDASVEEMALTELVNGPSSEKLDLRPVFGTNIKLLDASPSQGNEYLFITLSKEFLDVPADYPADWERDAQLYQTVMQTRRLALYAIANTVTEIGNYSKIQLFVATTENNVGVRIKRSDVGFTGEGADQPLGLIGREYSVLLTPKNACNLALQAIANSNWKTMYLYITDAAALKYDTIVETMDGMQIALESYSLNYESVTLDGKTAIVGINIKMKIGEKSIVKEDLPIKLQRENGVWKVKYQQMMNLLSK